MKKALEGEKMSTMIAAVLGGTVDDTRQGQRHDARTGRNAEPPPGTKKDQQAGRAVPSLKILSEELKKEIAEGRIQITCSRAAWW